MKPGLTIPILVLLLSSVGTAQSQNWRTIVPLKSTCDDVRKELGVDTCKFPVSNYSFDVFDVNLTFVRRYGKTDFKTYRVSQVVVTFKKMSSLGSFESDLASFEVLSDGDLGNSKLFRNKKKGILIAAQHTGDGPVRIEDYFVTAVTVSPPTVKAR